MASALHTLRAQLRWYELAPEALLAIGLGAFAVTEPHAAASAFHSSKALLLMVGVVALWVAARAALLTWVSRPALRALPFVLGAFAILKVVVLPAYDDHTVIEMLAAPTPASAANGSTEAAPRVIRTAMLSGIDHRANGTVNLYRTGAGKLVVGLENFDIQPGPAYALYLVPGEDRDDPEGGVRLSALRGNRGTQFYDAPDATGDTTAWTVLVWCETFDVPVARATPIET